MASIIKADTLQSTTSNVFVLNSVGTEYARFDSTGNMGIGTNSPSTYGAALAVVSPNTFGTITVKCTGTSGAAGVIVQNDTNTADCFMYAFNSAHGTLNAGIGTSKTQPLALYTNNTERMRIDSSGNVGIGLTNPSIRLDVVGASAASAVMIKPQGSLPNNNDNAGLYVLHQGTGGTAFRVRTDNAVSASYFAHILVNNASAAATALQVDQYGTGNIIDFTKSGTTAFRIDSSGNVLVNSTSNINFAAASKLFVLGNGTGMAVGYGTSTSQYRTFYMNSGDAALYFHNNSNYAYLSSAGTWTNASDVRLKKNIVDIKYGLADVLKMQPRSYQMNDVAGDFIGFVAQELQTVIPEVVSGDPEKQLGVDYGSLVAVAFKAIQEQQVLITQLQADVAALKAK